MPIERTEEAKRANARAQLRSRFNDIENNAKEAIGREKSLEKKLEAATKRIEALELRSKTQERNLEIVTQRHSDMLDDLRLRITCAGFIIAVIVAAMVVYALKLARVF